MRNGVGYSLVPAMAAWESLRGLGVLAVQSACDSLLDSRDVVAQRVDVAEKLIDILPRCDQRLFFGPVRDCRARDTVKGIDMPALEARAGFYHTVRSDVTEYAA